ncbi:ImmA/IrrE family metallo-endopeptidase [Pseudarthrobacter sulfonivorans]|uniref:ImmA/IrrE family metallo-endopeptidase n=1 Tax=Pseudarthrobacter sulfonivorans TaxID=121292 RepID=UPI0037C8F684
MASDRARSSTFSVWRSEREWWFVFSEPGVAAIDAYSLHTATRPIIILNPVKDDYYRQRFDVAHELGHLIMHHDAEPGGNVAEDQANR